MPNLYLAKCCAIPAGCFNPWIKGVSCDGYDCNPPKGDRVTLSIGTDFGLTTYASFDDGSPGADPCMFNGIKPWDRDLADIDPTAIEYTNTCNAYPSGVNYCCCAINSLCTPQQGGDQCEWFANDNKYPGSWFTDFNLLCTKDGISIASQTVEEDNYIACCGSVFMQELNCGQVACGCDQLYGNTTCNRSKIAYTFGDPCSSGGPCPPYVGYQYFTDEPVLTTYYGFDDAVNANVISASDPVGVFQTALTFNSLTGDTFTGGVLLNDHIVDPNDIITWPGILQGYLGSAPDLDTAFPIGVYSPMGIVPGGNPPWVTITLTMTSGPYNGITYTYNFYGTAEQFAAWALLNWDPVKTGRIEIIGSPDYWMGLRVPPDALNTVTGQYIPVHEYRRIMTRGLPGGYMPDNSDDFELFSATPTNIVWKARLRQFYTWRVFTTMQDIRAHGMLLENLRAVTGSCCAFDHCTQTRIWFGVTGGDPGVAPCTVINPLVDTSGSCGAEGAPYTTHTDTCDSSNCAVVQYGIGYQGYCTGYTQSTCFPSQYNVDMSYSYTQDPNSFGCSDSYCINLPP